MKVIKYESTYYKQVNDIYEKSFPHEERYITLDKMVQNKNTELYINNKKVENSTFFFI